MVYSNSRHGKITKVGTVFYYNGVKTNWFERCITCRTTTKEIEYPMCYSCFLKWNKKTFCNQKPQGFLSIDNNDELFIDDDDE
jgi:hypothetical protein